ncbi:hypothetical protein [Puia sp.]|jgi:hypothetical protein|uniref:hypothetical protein n=1 Tax=Puia sp. TaxID=2045100 RepID=UPI002F41497D
MKQKKDNTQPKNPDQHDPSQVPHKTPHKASIENPDKDDQPNPGKTNNIDDDPDQTRRKIPVDEKPERES